MIAAFSFAGLAEGDGLTLSILFGAATFAVGLIGGLVWILSGLRPGAKADDGEGAVNNRSLAPNQ